MEMDPMNNKNTLTSTSKFMSLVLRHNPGRAGLALDAQGWVPIDALLRGAQAAGRSISPALLMEVVRSCPKQRFAISADGLRIRVPPQRLYHGTATRFLDSILRAGLDRRNRHHVHLTDSLATARSVGQRYGKVVLLEIDAARMHAQSRVFYRSDNGVWLTDSVAPCFLRILPGEEHDEARHRT
jgi:putative RNA 2'-phosphotransferase